MQTFDLLSKPPDKNHACVAKNLYENVAEDGRFIWVERWKDLKTLNNYMSSDHYRSLLGAIEVLGELVEMQVVEFKDISKELVGP